MKKRYWLLIIASLLVCIFAFSGCGIIDKMLGKDEEPSSSNDKQFQAVYALYLDYAESKGETPLSYEAWLASIRGEDGKDGTDGKDGVGIESIVPDENGDFVITYTDGTTETVDMPDGTTTEGCAHSYGEWTARTEHHCGEIFSYRVCSTCSDVQWRYEGFTEHNFDYYYSEATCYRNGYEEKLCLNCGYYNEKELPQLDHSSYIYYSSDANYHWQNCMLCGEYPSYSYRSEHTFDDSGICSVCSRSNSKYPWNKTTLIFQMTENSNHQELPSTCRRYLAGDISGVTDRSTIDDYVSERNEEALKETNVSVQYQYLPDTAMYTWGENINTITDEVKSKHPGRPDMYCNFVYDMVAASLQGAFANLLSCTMYEDGHELAGAEHNYFEFTDPTFVDTGVGYMYEYMRSLSLSKWKMYCFASDYLIDLVRAETVIPVSIGLLETLTVDNNTDHLKDRKTTLDRNGNIETNYTIEDFYQLVYDREWNYETLAKFSQSISSQGEGDETYDLRDTVGFAVGTGSGLAASGLLYSTSITIIDREYDIVRGDYTYSYPYMNPVWDANGNVTSFVNGEGTHDELIAFCDNLNALFEIDGVITVSPHETHGFGAGSGWVTDISAIRDRFSTGHVLFGGIVTLGSLEYDEYKEMNGQGGTGYGIAPIPLYRTNYEEYGETMVDDYNTQIHNIGKIVAISYTTDNFAQCTAYLNYMSTHSTDILNEYYDFKLQYDVVGTGVKGNVEMLKYIRKNIRSSFDKTFEDALGRFYNAIDEWPMSQQWHTMIKNANYQLTDMDTQYATVTPVKAWRLYNLETLIFPTLPC